MLFCMRKPILIGNTVPESTFTKPLPDRRAVTYQIAGHVS